MGVIQRIFGSSEPTYGGKPVDEYKQLQRAETVLDVGAIGRSSGKTVRLDEPRIAWKYGESSEEFLGFTIIKLVIPEGARVVYPDDGTRWSNDTKLRTNAAYVAEIFKYDSATGNVVECDWETSGRYYSTGNDSDFEYREGTVAVPDEFNDSPKLTCTNGIHVYARKDGAMSKFN